ncbi:hypothetical protein GCM10022223_27670 [Kineosporia mesophila]|uniref:VapB protein of antitoxin of type II toxin-antitoxin system n=2 Tax=Kineosporia mesophila TaxID=566012 RepID=A0ABP6ZHL6_9ACTN
MHYGDMSREREGGQPPASEGARLTTTITVEGVDLALLRQAARLLGAEGAAVVDQALAELIRDRNQRRAVAAEIERYESGQFAGLSGLSGPAGGAGPAGSTGPTGPAMQTVQIGGGE